MSLQKAWSWLEGKKTFLLVLGGLLLWFGWVLNWWSLDQIDQLFALLGILGVGALRHGMSK